MSSAGAWERHGQTIIAGLILAAILWTGNTMMKLNDGLSDLNGTVGVVLNRIGNLEKQLGLMDERFDRYQTVNQAQAERANFDLRIQMIDSRLDTLKSKINERRAAP